MACSTAAAQFFTRTTNSSPPNQILMAATTGQSVTSTPSGVGGGSGGGPVRPTSANGPPSGAAPPSSQQSSPGAHPAGCCESGRPILADPLTGQTVCSCQYDAAQLLGYQSLAAATSGLPTGLRASMYAATAPYPSAAAAAVAAQAAVAEGYLPITADQSAFYPPSANGFDLKENLEAWRSLAAYPSMYYPYESPLAGYPFANGYGVDLNGARRKNATRETTSTLKAWLSEHRKNPYPTKGEKIMLAIITKMTLTQVSTWFANARRRLKKENKMTWEPRNRCDEDDDIADVDGHDGNDNLCNSGDEDASKDDDLDVGDHNSDLGECKEDSVLDVDDSIKCPPVREHPLMRLQSPHQPSPCESNKSDSLTSSSTSSTTNKPKFWSIVDTATSTSSNTQNNKPIILTSRPPTSLYSYASSPPGKILPQISKSRLDYPSLPYSKHPTAQWYGNPAIAPHFSSPLSTYGNISSHTTSVYTSSGQLPSGVDLAMLQSSRIPASFPNGFSYSSHIACRKSPPALILADKNKQLLSNSVSSQNRHSSTASVSSSPPSSPESKSNTDNV